MDNAIKALCIVILMMPVLASASPATNVFDGMVKTTEARGYTTSSGYAVGFGAASIRTPQVTFSSLFSVRPPSFRYGCNGIDFNLGAFSVINKDELIQQLRNVAQGSLMYAFGVAVDAMCSGCWTKMQEFARKIQEHAQLLRGGCESLMEEYGDDIAQAVNAGKDYLTTRSALENGTHEDAASAQDDADLGSVKDTCGDSCNVNYLYEFFKSTRYKGSSFVADAFALDDQEYFEIFQSLVGTVIVDTSTGTTTQEGDISFMRTLTADAFLTGSNPNTSGQSPSIIRCANYNDGCTEVSEVEDANWGGLENAILLAMNSLINKKQDGSGRLTANEIAIGKLMPFGDKALNYLVKDPQVTEDYIAIIASIVAADIALSMIVEYQRVFNEITSKGTTTFIPESAINRFRDNVNTLRENALQLKRSRDEDLRKANEAVSAMLNIARAANTYR